MTRILCNWRYWALAAVFGIAALGILAEPHDGHAHYALCLVASKAVGFAAAYMGVRLAACWARRGKLDEITDFVDKD